jgi:hypothetical protein
MLQQIVGMGHVVLSFILSIYFLWAPANLDFYYLIYFLLLNISWGLFKNECFISYIFKILENPKYEMGSTSEVSDYEAVLGPKLAVIFLNYILFMYLVNIIFIATRYKGFKDKILILSAGISYLLYVSILRTSEDKQKAVLKNTNIFIMTLILGVFLNE